MTELESVETEVVAWCASYVAAFNANDAERITAHWHFPALIIHNGQNFIFKTSDHFTKNTIKLLDFYKRQEVVEVRRKLNSFMVMSDGVVSITVDDVMLDAAEQVLVSWGAAYVLHRNEASWRAIAAVAEGEGEAWERRGTPMGS